MQTVSTFARVVAGFAGLLWCYVEPSLNYIAVCFFALLLDCYTAYRCNRRIYSRYREAINRNPDCKIDGRLRSCKMAKMVQDFSVLIVSIFLAVFIDNILLDGIQSLHLANYLAAIYCGVQFVSVLENESTCNGAIWARVLQRILADKTERHFDINLEKLVNEAKQANEQEQDNNPSKESQS